MASLVLLYNNYADQGLLSGGDWLSTLPVTNMLYPDIKVPARSSSALTTATVFDLNLGRPCDIDGLAFGPMNLTPGATWRARFYSDATMTTLVHDTSIRTAVGDSINWADANDWFEWEDPRFWLGIIGDIDDLPFYAYYLAAASFTAQYAHFEISDVGNADGYIDIGRLLVAQAFRPSVNYSENNQLTIVPLVDMVESLGGRRSYWERGIRRKAQYTFEMLDETEVFLDTISIMLRASISRQVFVIPDSADTTSGTRRSYLATLSSPPAIRQLLMEHGSTAFDLEEVL